MSLDLYLKTTHTVRHRGTGVYARRNGRQKELKTIEEVKAYFPDADLSDVREYDYEDNTVFKVNLTHNLTTMAEHVPIDGTSGTLTAYSLLWHPETNPLLRNEVLRVKNDDGSDVEQRVTRLSAELVRELMAIHYYISNHREELEVYNPENGWGDYSQLLAATKDLLIAVLDIPIEDYDEYYIYYRT